MLCIVILLSFAWTGGLFAAQPSPLRVNGADLLWNGENIALRGVAVGDVVFARKHRPLSDCKTIAQDWNANVVRRGVDPTVWKNQKRAEVLAELERQACAALGDLQKVRPVIVTEWGFERDAKAHFKGTPESFGDKFLRDFLVARNLHSVAWCWHAEWGPPLLQKDWNTPTEFGAFVQKYLKNHKAARP